MMTTISRLLARADAELLAAQFSAEPWERFTHAHLAAVRAAAAVVAARGRPTGRGVPAAVWEQLALVAPDLAAWSSLFADGARLRAALEAGRFEVVGAERAERALCDAEDFVDAARAAASTEAGPGVGAAGSVAPRRLAVRAS